VRALRAEPAPHLTLVSQPLSVGMARNGLEHLRAEQFVDHENLTIRIVVLFVGKLTL
jgi:hypothetical protein